MNGEAVKENKSNSMYHEKQRLQFCALHVLNNLFGRAEFERSELDAICERMTPNHSWFNPHRSFLGTGNYDVNVLMAALSDRNYDMNWYDKRKNLEDLDERKLCGIIINLESKKNKFLKFPFLWGNHWICLRRRKSLEVDNSSDVGADTWFNLDSKLPLPQKIGNWNEHVIKYLNNEVLGESSMQMFLVVKQSDPDVWSK